MITIKAFIMLGLMGVTIAADCKSDFGSRCKHKSEFKKLADYADYFKTGDPCFFDDELKDRVSHLFLLLRKTDNFWITKYTRTQRNNTFFWLVCMEH